MTFNGNIFFTQKRKILFGRIFLLLLLTDLLIVFLVDTEMCVRRNNIYLTTTIIDSNEAIGMEHELDCARHQYSSVVTSIPFFSATLFIPLSLKITIRDGFHETL